MSRRMIRWTRSDAENGMRADSCPSDKPEGEGEGEGKERSGHATSSVQERRAEREEKVWWRRWKEFDRIRGTGEEGGGFLLIYALKMPIDIYRYCHSRAAALLSPPSVSRGYSRNLNSISPWYFK